MKKLIFLIFSIMTMAFYADAQFASSNALEGNSDADLTEVITTDVSATPAAPVEVVTVMGIKGKVKYSKPDSRRFKKLKEGAILDKRGKIKVKRKASVTLLNNGVLETVTAKGKHSLASYPVASKDQGDDFLAFLADAGGWGEPGGGGTPPPDSSDDRRGGGGAGEGVRIIGQFPINGKVPASKVNFNWSGKSTSGFTVNIYEGNDDKPMVSRKASGNELAIDLSAIKGMKKGETYRWNVTKETEGLILSSKKIEISVVDSSEASKALGRIEKSNEYRKMPAWQQAIRSARELESKGLYYDAREKYRQAVKAHPNNELVKSANGYFLKNARERLKKAMDE